MNRVEAVNELVTAIAGTTGYEGSNALEALTKLANGFSGETNMYTNETAAIDVIAAGLEDND